MHQALQAYVPDHCPTLQQQTTNNKGCTTRDQCGFDYVRLQLDIQQVARRSSRDCYGDTSKASSGRGELGRCNGPVHGFLSYIMVPKR